MFRAFMSATLVAIPSASVAQVPAPPPLPGQDAFTEELLDSLKQKDVVKYAGLLADNVQVFEDGTLVARSRTDWMKVFGPKLSAKGVSFKVVNGYYSTGRLLVIEYFNSANSWGGDVPAHCCWSYDAVSYDLVAGKVAVIRRLRGGSNPVKGLSGAH